MLDYKSNRKLGGGEMGNISVDANATFQAGQIATYGSDGTATVATSATVPCGVFKWNKASTLYGIAIAETITDAASGLTYNLSHANVSNVRVLDSTGTLMAVTTDYTINTTNGIITNTGTGSIAVGETITVSYTYQKTEADINNEDGKNFFNTNDDTAGSGKITLLQGNWRIYTDQFDTAQSYTMNAQLYVDNSGRFSTASALSGGYSFGRVVAVPTAASPWLGVEGDLSV